jgi:ribonuclease G
MSKELFVSSTPHETKLALVEDEQLAEVYFERENEYTLAGSIYKGRVTRVLPGMQSAFVDIGLERDAFLYVSDFFELPEDEEGEVQEISAPRPVVYDSAPAEETAQAAESLPAAEASDAEEPGESGVGEASPTGQPRDADAGEGRSSWRNRRRRRGRRGRGLPESKYAQRDGEDTTQTQPAASEPASPSRPAPSERAYQPMLLPGESISKYQHLTRNADVPAALETETATAPAIAPSEREEPSRDTMEASAEPEENLGRERLGGSEDGSGAAMHQHGRQDDAERFQRINLAAAAGPEEAIAEAGAHQPGVSATQEREEPSQTTVAAVTMTPGTVEEEEIEEEVSSSTGPAERLEDSTFEEVEEETSYRAVSPEVEHAEVASTAFGDTPAEPHEPLPSFGREEEEPAEDEEDELSESEMLADAAQEEAEAAENNGRAEVRAAAGTAGFQQRAPRPGFDRRRGRRTGGRFRGRGEPQRSMPAITELLKEGQEILVQIAKEPIGKKGARITSHIALPGRFLVYMPTVNHTGVSRKIASDEERQRLKRIVLSERENGHGGFIVRTAAERAPEEELRADIRFLKNLWNEIKGRAESGKSPALIYHDLNLVERVLRDQVTQDFSQIWVDNEDEYQRVLRFVSRFQPALTKRVKLYTKSTPLFEQFNLQEEINKALKSKVWLKSGGYIVINQTEALVAIDVNTGKYVGKTTRLEDTIVKTNVDAIKEIVRQIRLRDLGGIIVIDFIDMDERRNRQKVMQALEEALRADRAPSKVLQFNDFGLVAITRKRVKQSLERTLGCPCPYCTGTGFVKSVTTICNEIYTEMRKIAKQLEGQDVMLRVNPEVGKALKANNGRWLQDMEELSGRTVIVKADAMLHQEQFDIQ